MHTDRQNNYSNPPALPTRARVNQYMHAEITLATS